METPLQSRIVGLLVLGIASAGLLRAQSPAPELVVQRADLFFCKHAAFSHDGRLLATDNGSEVLVWEVSTGRLLNSMKAYRSPEIKHMNVGILYSMERAKGTIVFSPDDKMLAVLPVDFANPLNFGPSGAPALLWNVDTGVPLTTAQWNLDDGIARNDAAPSTPEVETWMISDNRKAVAELLGKAMKLQAISADGRMGASRNDEPRNDQHIQLIDLKGGQVLRILDATFIDVLAMVLSPDGRYLAAHSSNRRFVTVWDTASGSEVTEIKQEVRNPSVGHISFSPDGKWLAVQYSKEAVLFETATWKRTSSLPLDLGSVFSGELVFSPDSRALAVAGHAISLINVETRKLTGTACASPLHELSIVNWSEKSGMLAVASDKFARVWTADPKAPPIVLTAERTIQTMAASRDDRFVALGTRDSHMDGKAHVYYDGDTRLWQLGNPLKEVGLIGGDKLSDISGASANSIAFASDGKTLAAAMLDLAPCDSKDRTECSTGDLGFVGLLTVWDTTTGKLLRKRRQPDPNLNAVVFSPDGSQIATAQQNQIVKTYDAATLDRIHAFENPEARAPFGVSDYGTSALAYSPDGELLLAGSRDGLVWLIDAGGKNPQRILRQVKLLDQTKPNYEAPSGAIVSVLFSEKGKRAYAVESTGAVWVWSTADWTSAGDYRIEAGASSARLSPNGRVLAIANSDGAIRFYGAASGKLKLTVASTADVNSGLAVATDGTYDVGNEADLSLALYRVGRKTVTIDRLPGTRRVQGLLNEFLKENAEPKVERE
jgi:WD40 repeat protein